MIWNIDNNHQLLAITNQLTDEALIRKSLKTIANDTDEYVYELNTDANEDIDIFTDRIIGQFLLWLTSHDLDKEIVARYKAGRNVEHIIAYLQMLIGFISWEPHLVLVTTGIINVFANDTGGNKDDLSITDFSETSSQGVMIASDENNGLRYTSAADGFRGINSFEYSISDENGGTDSGTVTITVPNEAPEAVDDEATVGLGTTGTIDVLANDTDINDHVLSVTGFSETSSQGGTIASDGNSLHYTPAARFAGTDSFEYSISDGNGGIDSGTVTITVPNEAPEAVDDEATVGLGTTGTIDVLANDTDINDHVLSVTGFSETSSQGGTIASDGNSLHYTPAARFAGTDSFEYSISDGNGGIDSGTVTITVPDDLPEAVGSILEL